MKNTTKNGLIFASLSICLTTIAQLSMKFGMVSLPDLQQIWETPSLLLNHINALVFVGIGILAYGFSMIAWLFALQNLPLSQAYPMLSISYVLVFLSTVSLPWFHESITTLKILGVLLICTGVLLTVKPSQM